MRRRKFKGRYVKRKVFKRGRRRGGAGSLKQRIGKRMG